MCHSLSCNANSTPTITSSSLSESHMSVFKLYNGQDTLALWNSPHSDNSDPMGTEKFLGLCLCEYMVQHGKVL